MVVDLRRVNEVSELTATNLPSLENQLSWMPQGSCYFGGLDALSGFDMLSTKMEHRKFFCIATPFGVFRMNAAPQGFCNTPGIFMDRMINEILGGVDGENTVFATTPAGSLQWLDDSLLYAPDFPSYLKVLTRILRNCLRWHLRLNVDKCEFIAKEIYWCGRRITSSGWNFKQDYFNRILEVPRPVNVKELEAIVYMVTWLATAIPECSRLKDRLNTLMMTVRDKLTAEHGKRVSKKKRDAVELGELWTKEHEKDLTLLKKVLVVVSRTTMTNYDRTKRMQLFSDASYEFWASYLTLEVKPNLFLPLGFLSGKFTKAKAQWAIPDKELYPIVRTLVRFNFITAFHGTRIEVHTDHKNLIYLFNPPKTVRTSSVSRLYRWVLLTQTYPLKVCHISGTSNVLADFMTRWGYSWKKPDAPKAVERRAAEDFEITKLNGNEVKIGNTLVDLKDSSERQLLEGKWHPIAMKGLMQKKEDWNSFITSRVSFLSPHFKQTWSPLTLNEIRRAQKDLRPKERPKDAILEEGVLRKAGKLWIPRALIPKLVIDFHHIGGHAAVTTELEELWKKYAFPLTKEELKVALQRLHLSCLHCDKYPYLLRRPLGSIIHADKPNKVLHCDYLKLEGAYILVLTDDFTRKLLLRYTPSADSATLVDALVLWKGHFGLPKEFILYSDRGSHFCSQLVKSFENLYPFQHKYAVSYCPWTNGSAESANVLIIKYFRSLMSQYGLPRREWRQLLPLV